MKKTLMLVAMCALGAGSVLGDTEVVTFRDYDAASGTFTNAACECSLVTAETRELTSGWWAVKGDIELPENGRLVVQGDAHLILCDEAKLNIEKPGENNAAVNVPNNASLIIYGQTAGTGVLTALGGHSASSIGGGKNGAGGAVTINGGTVTATGSSGAGIGGGEGGKGGAVTINGGTVTATGSYGAGIGGGKGGGAGGAVTINGGTVTATSLYGAGIGGGRRALGGTVTINGGTVTATSSLGAGIGGGESVTYSGTTTIVGGAIRAESIYNEDITGNVRISGGIFSIEPNDAWIAQGGKKVMNPDEATKEDYPWMVIPPFVVTVGSFPFGTVAWTSGDGAVTNAVEGGVFGVMRGAGNVKVIFTAKPHWEIVGDGVVSLGTVTEDIIFGEASGYRVPVVWHEPIPYIDADGVERIKVVGEFDSVTAETRILTDGWYLVEDNINIQENANLMVEGDVHLILCDGASLTVNNVPMRLAAVSVGANTTLTVYGQNAGTGCLTAIGGNFSAGIGGGDGCNGGIVTVNGGIVTATGGLFASGIGGGDGGTGGMVTINGGAVAAYGCTGGAGIGGGRGGNGGAVTITGGRITVQGAEGGANIGSGNGSFQIGTIAISGGIFANEPENDWLATHCLKVENLDAATKDAYPWKVLPPCVVTVGANLNMGVVWTSGDGTKMNEVRGASFTVPHGTENVKVIFTADDGYEIVSETNEVSLGTVTENITFGGESDYSVPLVEIKDPCLVAFDRGMWNMSIGWTRGDGSVTNMVAGSFNVVHDDVDGAIKGTYVPRGSTNVRIICRANAGYELVGDSEIDLGTVMENITFRQGNDFRLPIAYDSALHVVYLDWDEENGRMTNAVATTDFKRWTEVTEATRVLQGCMVVTNDVTIPIAEVSGASTLVLCNDATLTVTGVVEEAGILVPGDTSLTITVRKGSSGRVVAHGGTNCAGIGSKFKQGVGSVLGAVRIVAGMVTATGGRNAAGIGNGFYGKGGSVKIFGGAVTAIGGIGGASDIGDGTDPYSPCEVSVSGGVFARELNDDWLELGYEAVENPDEATKAEYPWAVKMKDGEAVGEGVYVVVENGVCTIFGTGKATELPSGFNRNSITSAVVGDGITEVGARFFKSCYRLNTLKLGKDVAKVDEKAFLYCMSLENIEIDNPNFDLSSLDAAVSYHTAIKSDGSLYPIPNITVSGCQQKLEGKAELTDGWTNLGAIVPGKAMEDYTGYRFFRIVVKPVE